LLDVHAEYYLDSLRRPAVIARALELDPLRKLPGWLIDWCVLRPMRWATMGTVEAATVALELGLAVNLGGGYHRNFSITCGGAAALVVVLRRMKHGADAS